MFAKKNLRLILALLAVTTVLCALSVGCSTASVVSFNAEKFVVGVGKELTLDFTVFPKKADYSLRVDNETVATVAQNGVVKGLKTGITVVTLASGDKTATATLVVSDATDPTNVDYNQKKEYTVSFFLDYPLTLIKNESYREGELITFALPTYSAYDVDGWFTDASCSTRFDTATQKVQDNLTLYCRRT